MDHLLIRNITFKQKYFLWLAFSSELVNLYITLYLRLIRINTGITQKMYRVLFYHYNLLKYKINFSTK